MPEQLKIPYTVSFVVPALNEEKVVDHVVREIHSHVNNLIQTNEIILIDDGSTDRTGEIMEALARELPNMRVLHNRPNIGLGASYQRGVAEARHDYVMMLCGDGGLPASSLPPIIEKIGTADIVVPYMTNLKTIKTPMRYFISRSYTHLLNFLSGHRLNYYNGLPVHKRNLLNRTVMTSSGFGLSGGNPRQTYQIRPHLRPGWCARQRDDQQVIGFPPEESRERHANRAEARQVGYGFSSASN